MIALKIVSSGILIAGSLGLLWHKSISERDLSDGTFDPPAWLLWINRSCDPCLLNLLSAMFHSSKLNAAIYAAVSLLCLLSIFMVPFIRSSDHKNIDRHPNSLRIFLRANYAGRYRTVAGFGSDKYHHL